jgi:hypothetical protein
MKLSRIFLLAVASAASVALPAISQEAAPAEIPNLQVFAGNRIDWPASRFTNRVGEETQLWVLVPDEAPIRLYADTATAEIPLLQFQADKRPRLQAAVVEYKVQIAEPGAYELWFRGAGADGGSNSAYLRIPEASGEHIEIGAVRGSLDSVPWRPAGPPIQIGTAGTYTVELSNREPNFCVIELSLRRQ